jgi:hypothetical protein
MKGTLRCKVMFGWVLWAGSCERSRGTLVLQLAENFAEQLRN